MTIRRTPTALYATPLGYTSRRPVALPPIDRRALMANAHRIARKVLPRMASYREALAYGPDRRVAARQVRNPWPSRSTRRDPDRQADRGEPARHPADRFVNDRVVSGPQ